MTGNQQMILSYGGSSPPISFSPSSTFNGTSGPQFYSVTFGASIFVAVGGSGAIYSSTNGSTWTNRSSGTAPFSTATWVRVIFSSSMFVAVGNGSSGITIAYSTNGTSWTFYTITGSSALTTLAISNVSANWQICANGAGSITFPGTPTPPTVGPVLLETGTITSAAWTNKGSISGSSTSTTIMDLQGEYAFGQLGSSNALIGALCIFGSGSATLNPILPNTPATTATFGGNYATNVITPDNVNYYLLNYNDIPFMAHINAPGGLSTNQTWTITNNTNSNLTGISGQFFKLANGNYFTGGYFYTGSAFIPRVAYATNPVAVSGSTSWSLAATSGTFNPSFIYTANDVAYGGGTYVVVGTSYIGFFT